MEAKDLVGKLVTSNYLESRRTFPPGATFKVVGYECDLNWVIIDADLWLARFGYVRPCNREVQNLLVSPTM